MYDELRPLDPRFNSIIVCPCIGRQVLPPLRCGERIRDYLISGNYGTCRSDACIYFPTELRAGRIEMPKTCDWPGCEVIVAPGKGVKRCVAHKGKHAPGILQAPCKKSTPKPTVPKPATPLWPSPHTVGPPVGKVTSVEEKEGLFGLELVITIQINKVPQGIPISVKVK